MVSLASLTTLLNPFMTFIALMAFTFFIFFLRDKVNSIEKYIRSIAISLQKISAKNSREDEM